MEFTAAGTSKAIGLRWLADRLKVPMAETMAIGDSENDAAILEAAGFSVAMGNAPEKIKKCADAVTLSNTQDGVARAIEEHVLKHCH